MSYSTQADYTERTGDTTISTAEHDRISKKAAEYIDFRTFGRAKDAPAEMQDAVKNAEIDLIEQLLAWQRSGVAERPPEVASENNDGYAISYRTDIVSTQTARNRAMLEILRRHLMLPVNLLYQGGGVSC